MHQTTDSKTPDSLTHSWVDKAPVAWRPYLRLARFDRPIGSWLLLLPCWWAITLASLTQAHSSPDIGLMLLFALGAVAMRGAGCVYNDIVDRDIDARVARTRGRPLPSGQVSLKQAWLWLFFLCGLGLMVLIALKPVAQAIALMSLLLVAAYPFMKRITWWPQAWLGLTFNWGALVGWSAVTNSINMPAVLLYAAGVFWTLGYDTIYALQDIEDDALAGVKSSARRLGGSARKGIAVFYVLTALFLLAAAGSAGLESLWLLLSAFFHLAWQVSRLAPDIPDRSLQLFRSNRDFGLLILLVFLLHMGGFWRT